MKRKAAVFLVFLFSLGAFAQSNKSIKAYNKARELLRTDEIEEAEKSLLKAIEDSPEYAEARMLLADIYKKQDEPKLALNQYQQALKYNPPYYVNLYYARLLFSEGEYEKASKFFTAYLKSPKANPKYQKEINQLLASCAFAAEAMKNPKDFDPINLGEQVNSAAMQYFPSISADGNTLVFTHRWLEGNKLDEDFWITKRDSSNAPWQKSEVMRGFLNSTGNEGAQSISADGKVLFFAACERPKGYGSCDIFASFLKQNGTWSEAVNLGPNINSALWESQPSIAPDGKTLYFVRGTHGTAKNLDIYYSKFTPKGWTKAKKLEGAINTSRKETSPFIHFDNKSLYFSSDGHPGMGDLDFFVSRKKPDGTWGEPENLGYPINGPAQDFSLIVAPNGKTGFFSSDAVENGFGKLDLYEFRLPPESQAKQVAYLTGKVIDKKTRKPLTSQILFSNLDDSTFVFEQSSGKDGRFYAVLPANSDYALAIAKKGYLFYSQNFKLKEEGKEEALYLLVELIPIEEGQSVRLENIFFAFDSYVLDKKSDLELHEILKFLAANPNVKISVEGHTDNEGSAVYNKELSQNRAKAVYQYLVNQGVNKDRLTYVGYGSEKPIATNETEKGRALNRRTEMRIVEFN